MSEHINESSILKDADGKIGTIVKHCLYIIATGKWRAGTRLPSIRIAEKMWSVNHLTIQRAYRRLEELGLVESRPRSGYFVARDEALDRIALHRHELDRFHRKVTELIREDLGLSTLGVLRYLAQLEEIRSREEPECAFVECTTYQAAGHAKEISERLHLSVLALSTTDIKGRRTRIPHHVRRILTTHFHFEEVNALADPPRLSVAAIPIEISLPVISHLASEHGKILLLETEQEMARHLADDVERRLKGLRVKIIIASDVEAELNRLFSARSAEKSRRTIYLSPRVWGSLEAQWQKHPLVRSIEFQICESAWQTIAVATGLPLGLFAS